MSCDPGGQKDLKKMVDKLKEYGKELHGTGDQELDYERKQRAANVDYLTQFLDTTLPIMQRDYQEGKDLSKRYEDLFLPIEQRFVDVLSDYDTGEHREKAANEAVQETRQQAANVRQQAEAQLAGMGIDVDQIHQTSLDRITDIGEATQEAQAATGARKQIAELGQTYMGQLYSLGQDTAGQAYNAFGQATGAGQQALTNTLSTAQTGARTVGTPGQFYEQGTKALAGGAAQAGHIGEDNWLSTAGMIVGTAVGAYFGGYTGAKVGGQTGQAMGNLGNSYMGG